MSDWNRDVERALFDAALAFPDESARHRFLDATCGDNVELKTKLLGLLADDARAATFFDFVPPVPSITARRPRPEQATPGSEASATGRYRILRQIGEGGSGVVYLAEQTEPVRREVALKVLRRGINSARAGARFEVECDALARMNHPGIARVYDAGWTEEGRRFFAMELVTGERITRYCATAGADLAMRVRLLLQVCQAVQHAHEKGIIHRDLKPSNVLVSIQAGVPMPKIIDFGIARFFPVADDRAAGAEPFAGTPAYMSPEQADLDRADEDTRTDVYGLGALLYELLLARAPFDPARFDTGNIAGIQRVLRDEAPERPSKYFEHLDRNAQSVLAGSLHLSRGALLDALRDDLDWIVVKALAKDRQQRFATVQALSTDLQRWLDGEAVASRPPATGYRLRKFVRRHWVGFAASAAVFLSLVIGLGVSTWLYVREREAVRVQRQLREEAEDAVRITRAVYLARDGRLAAANSLLAQVSRPPDRPSYEGVTVYRLVGDWVAAQKRWRETAARFGVVQRFGVLDEWGQVTRDHQSYGVALIAAKDAAGYDRFREEHARRFSGVVNGDAVGRVLKICLLRPADNRTATLLEPLGRRVEAWFATLPREYARTWATIPIALWRYRQGDFAAAAEAARGGFDEADHASSCTATQRLLLALCAFRTGNPAEGRRLAAVAHDDIERVFATDLPAGDARDGFWYDWLFARILLEEAMGVPTAAG